MLISTPTKSIAALLLGLAAVLAPVHQAGAAIFIGTFDPSFGGNLADLGFRGQATFDIPDACLGQTGFLVSNSGPCSNGGMFMTAATVELYRFSNLLAPTLDTATFAPPPVSLIDALFGIDPVTGQPTLLGVNTPVVGPRLVNVFDGGTIYAGNLWLEFQQPAPLIILNTDSVSAFASVPASAAAGAYLFACDPFLNQNTSSSTCTQIQSDVATVRFTRVPEPATAGLVLLAFAGIAVVRGRRSLLSA